MAIGPLLLAVGPPTSTSADLYCHHYFVKGILRKIYNIPKNVIVNQTQECSFPDIFCKAPGILIRLLNAPKCHAWESYSRE